MKSRKTMQSTSSNPDGTGYSTKTGIMDDERVIFEASSGPRRKDLQHTYGDTLKNMEALTSIIMLKAYKLSNARFSTLTRYKSIKAVFFVTNNVCVQIRKLKGFKIVMIKLNE